MGVRLGHDTHSDPNPNPNPNPDQVCGSDTTYDEEAHAPLCDTLSALLLRARRDGEIAPRAVLAMEHMEPLERPGAKGDGSGGQTDNSNPNPNPNL